MNCRNNSIGKSPLLAASIFICGMLMAGCDDHIDVIRDQDIPVAPGAVLARGDLLQLIGPEALARRAAQLLGIIVQPSEDTDMVTLGLAIGISVSVNEIGTATLMRAL